MILVTGAKGVLGKQLMVCLGRTGQAADFRGRDGAFFLPSVEGLILAGGTKGFAACEGNAKVFRDDVDLNIFVGRQASKQGIFTVFVSTDAVEVAQNGAYARNRFLVELALGSLPHVGIFRPGRFDDSTAFSAAQACLSVLTNKKEGVTKWP